MSDENPPEKTQTNAVIITDFDLDNVSQISQMPKNMRERREKLIRQYYDGEPGIVAKLEKLGKNELRHLVFELSAEILKEADNLAGNRDIALEDGNLAASSAISAKRAEVIEKALKAIQTKEMFERERGIDIDSPSMEVFFNYFFGKVKFAMEKSGIDEHVCDIFFRILGEMMINWKKEVKTEIDKIQSIGKK